jgi:N-acetylglucosamine-6-phosphate deacetylase
MNLLKKFFDSEQLSPNLKTEEFIIQLTNCRILRGSSIYTDDLWVRAGTILDPEKIFYEEKRQSDLQIDCDNLILVPGFIDAQINGGFGHDFSSNSENISESLDIVSRKLLQYGVTSFCPTIISSDKDTYKRVLPNIKRTDGGSGGAAILGVHLEGPFISKEKLGAHPIKYLRGFNDSIDELHDVYGPSLENISIITLAPELDPNGTITRYLTNDLNIIVSIGHSMASLEQGENSIRNGARFITHLFNAMLPFHHRDPHLFGLLSDRSLAGNLFYGIIADGIHTHASALNMAYKTLPNGLVIVTVFQILYNYSRFN